MQTIIISVLVFLWLGIAPGLAAQGDKLSLGNPPLPKSGVRVVPPDPQLPPEIRAFSGVWEGSWSRLGWDVTTEEYSRTILIVEEIISPEKVRVIYSVGSKPAPFDTKGGWKRYWGSFFQVNDTYFLTFQRPDGAVHTFNLKGDKLVSWFGRGSTKFHTEMTRRPDQPASERLAAPLPLPKEGVKIIPPSPQLPLEIRAFSGTWEGTWGLSSEREPGKKDFRRAILIVEEIVSPEKVRVVYSWGPAASGDKPGVRRHVGTISKEKDRYVLSFKRPKRTPLTFTLVGDNLLAWDGVQSKYEIKMSRKPDKS